MDGHPRVELMAGCAAIITGISSFSLTKHIYNLKVNGGENGHKKLDAINGNYLILNILAASIWFLYHLTKKNTMAIILSIIILINLSFIIFLKYY